MRIGNTGFGRFKIITSFQDTVPQILLFSAHVSVLDIQGRQLCIIQDLALAPSTKDRPYSEPSVLAEPNCRFEHVVILLGQRQFPLW